jgi:hypothetical protein
MTSSVCRTTTPAKLCRALADPDRTGKLFDDEGDLGAIGHLTRLLSDRYTTHQFFFKRGANPTA